MNNDSLGQVSHLGNEEKGGKKGEGKRVFLFAALDYFLAHPFRYASRIGERTKERGKKKKGGVPPPVVAHRRRIPSGI